MWDLTINAAGSGLTRNGGNAVASNLLIVPEKSGEKVDR